MNDTHINDGGPAFPQSEAWGSRHPVPGGMTLRDYFAAQAMAALIAEPLNEGQSSSAQHWTSQLQMHTRMSGPDIIARAAYMMADAMLKAREGEQ